MPELLPRSAICSLIEKYNHAVDTGSLDLMEGVFARDAELRVGKFSFNGVKNIIDGLREIGSSISADRAGNYQRHHLSSRYLYYEEGVLKGTQYVIVFSELGLDHCGIYTDTYGGGDGHWLIEKREGYMEWSCPKSRFRALFDVIGPVRRQLLAPRKLNA